jgi:hypothetical protein
MENRWSRALAALTLAFVVVVQAAPGSAGVVATQHNDNQRTGANLSETLLTPQAVASHRLQRSARLVDGWMYGQVLYASGVGKAPATHDLAFVATTNDTVYAFDANDASAGPFTRAFWKTTLPKPDGWFARGIFSTPVLEYAGGAGTIDVVYSVSNRVFPYAFDVHDELALRCVGVTAPCTKVQVRSYVVKLDVASGAIVKGPVELAGSVRRSDGSVLAFDASNEFDNPALLLDHGYLYVSFGARQSENVSEYYGWMLRYRADTLEPAGAFNVAPNAWLWPYPGSDPAYRGTPQLTPFENCYAPRNGHLKPWTTFTHPIVNGGAGVIECVAEGGGIWQGGAGPAADADGNVYVLSGNGRYAPGDRSYGNAVLKLTSTAEGFGLAASFAPREHRADLETYDVDLGSAGPLLVGDDARSVIAGGKTGLFYVLDNGLRQRGEPFVAGVSAYTLNDPGLADFNRYRTWNVGPHFHGSPTLWRLSATRSYVYQWAEKDYLKRYVFERGRFTGPARAQGPVLAKNCTYEGGKLQLSCLDAMPGGMLSLTANGTQPGSGVVWALLRGQGLAGADMVYAFDADSLRLLWSDDIGDVPHFAEATVADGKLFVPTSGFVLYIYRLGAQPAAVRASSGRKPWPWPPGGAMPAMRAATASASARGTLPDYAADPMFRARLLIAELQPPPGMVPTRWYAVEGDELYDCRARAPHAVCTNTGTAIRKVYDYDERTHTASAAPLRALLAAPATIRTTTRTVKAAFPRAAAWQRLERPGAIFGSAPYVMRLKTTGGAPPSTVTHDGETRVPFTAIYTAFGVPPASSKSRS